MRALLGAALCLAMIAALMRAAGRAHRLLHFLQLEHYEGARLLMWLRRRSSRRLKLELAGLLAVYAGAVAARASGEVWLAALLLLLSCVIAYEGVAEWTMRAVKPLVLTPRARRLLATALTPALIVALGAVPVAVLAPSALAIGVVLLTSWLLLALSAHVLLSAKLLLAPLERRVNSRFVDAAERRLREVAPLRIGITGSYGKTTTKLCVGAVLSADRKTLVSPASFNSHLGLVRTINEHLKQTDEAFVAEMGMFRRGDIAQLCELVRPSIGVLTAIGPMHLERLGSMESIMAAKGELMEALPADGFFITNGDDPRCLAIAKRSSAPVTLFAVENEDAQVRASSVKMEGGRTHFDLVIEGDEAAHVSAALLGAHNVCNMLAAAAVGWVLGIDPRKIASALETVAPPQHRLSSIHNDSTGVVVLDDAYNSNPVGAAAALEVLREHAAKRRLLVTPGMVELGELEEQLNRSFGERAGEVCDLVILVGGVRTRPMSEGLVASGMSERDIHVVADMAAATALLARLTRRGDVVLFENDLPDTYLDDPLREERVTAGR